MKKIKLATLLIVPSMLLGACSQGGDTPTPEPPSPTTKVYAKMDASLNENKKEYNLEFQYDDAYFKQDAKIYSKELSLLSFGSSITDTDEDIESFFSRANFENVEKHSLDETPTIDSIGFILASKKIDDFDLVAVSIRGFNYGAEWADNFRIGRTGDHYGFINSASDVYDELQDYISSYTTSSTVKLWIAGYSRAGAVSNALASLILREEDASIEQSNMFVYTFEAPACLESINCVAYENVHNIRNQNDLITKIPPTYYGLGRCGIDYQIYDENVSSIVKMFDRGIEIPAFVPIEVDDHTIDNDTEFANFLIDTIFKTTTSEYSANTRDEYVDRYESGLSYIIGLIFALKDSTRNSMLDDLLNMGFSVLSVLSSAESVASFLTTYLERDTVSYDEETLLSASGALRNAIMNLFMRIILIYASTTYRPSLVRLIDMHYPETTYSLLTYFHESLD